MTARRTGRAGVLAAVIALAAAAPALAAADPLNVLFLSVDDLRPELGTYGAPAVTPNIDRLARGGMRFDRAFTAIATCAASRASLLTGTYPPTTGVFTMEPTLNQANPDLVTLPRIFRDAGYEAVEVGKFAHVPEDTPDAWSRPRIMPDWNPPEYLAPGNGKWTGDSEPPRGPLGEAANVPDGAYVDGRIARRAIDELRRLRERPFFLAVGFIRPHLPFNCPARYWELYQRRASLPPGLEGLERVHPLEWHDNYELAMYTGGKRIGDARQRFLIHGYRACVSYVDALIGTLLDELERLGLADRTLVVLWGDHGWHLGEHGIWGKNTALDPSLRIPLIVRGPGVPAGASTRAFVETVDILPTLAELAGLPIPEQVEGTSFVPLFSDPERVWKRAVFGWRRRAVREAETVRTEDFRFVRWVNRRNDRGEIQSVELYDHRVDPREYVNVVREPKYAVAVQRLNWMLDAWQEGQPVAWKTQELGSMAARSRGSGSAERVARELLWPVLAIAVGLAVWLLLRRRALRTSERFGDRDAM
jgi:arylsulfatase A-like enzyme